jgi:hypothetical protein
MSNEKRVPGSLSEFLKDGAEVAEYSICIQPFDRTHLVIQIKKCGHHVGEECLMRRLKQKDSKGIYPTCRGVLFVEKAKVRSDPSITAPLPVTRPLSPAMFNDYYRQPGNTEVSNRSRAGFLGNLWALLSPTRGSTANQLTSINTAITQAFDAGNDFSTDENSQSETCSHHTYSV